MKSDPDRLFDRSPRAVAGLYLLFGATCVILSDLAIGTAFASTDPFSSVRIVSGLALVGASSAFLYVAVRHHSRRAVTARGELETSNQQLQVLSRVFRHNVRNDLNVVQGYADLLERRLDDERSRECLETIRETTEDMVEISEKLRVIEDASTGPVEERVDLTTVVHEAVEELDDERTDAEFSLDLPDRAWIHADESVIYPVREVLENAIAHNDDPGRRVLARVETNGTTTRLEVQDNGPGIPEGERAVLRAEEETPLSHASSIGLWLVKWMCELQEGTVHFDATEDGTTVLLRFRSTDRPPDR
ncbi:sensor histidine kinase [Halorubrum sp. 48-1-W]|uniref:sensor histidine kinase n=1 Tax=Halorubrum sp. 48-1-W TaxID=2249761 RepID=UPI000DCF5978|nr:HAMP domain-containing sensor histidine kinase [Halorubrum sp. 48-1-W]RAW47056.1 sensor histidine kinase [Halorubrum sp. 48-1-W]